MPITAGVDAYADIVEADDYCSSRGISAWTNETETEKKESSLIVATDFIENIARGKWKGSKTDLMTSLSWPRKGVTTAEGILLPNDEIPQQLKSAAIEAAVRVLSGENLEPDEVSNVASESVGSISISYFQGKSTTPSYSKIYGLLDDLVISPLGKSTSGTIRVYRGI